MEYRKEIDGLRALAVLPVIFFHTGLSTFSGGYVGVDIFFVISGYLITSLILNEQKTGAFSIVDFYERRARRILPALTVVLFFATLAAYSILDPWLLKQFSQSLVSVASFSSNVFFYLKSGYFSAASDQIPLIHTWSLAVEEQYYLFFPILVVLLWPYGQRALIWLLILVALFSLALADYLSDKSVDANFYLIFSRAWELFSGSIIAFVPRHNIDTDRWIKDSLSTLGLILLAYSIFFFDESTPFPSIFTLVPVIGTSLIILFSDPHTIVGRFLSKKILVAIGLMSYSLYLWHHPIFSFLRHLSIGEPEPKYFALAIVLSFLISFLSWKYIEKPFRNRKKLKRRTIAWLASLSVMCFLLVGFIGHFGNGFPLRFNPSLYADSIQHSPKRDDCHTCCRAYLPPNQACRYLGKKITWAAFGDSHMVELAYALSQKLKPYDEGLLHLTFSGCPPSYGFELKNISCTSWINQSVAYLANQESITHIFLGFRYSDFLFGNQADSYPHTPNIDPTYQLADAYQNYSQESSRELYWEGFERIISTLLATGKVVYVLYPIPELPIGIRKAIMPLTIFGTAPLLDLARTTTAAYYFERHRFILDKLNRLPYGPSLRAVKPFDILCHNEYCPMVKEGKALYFDDHHLSLAGANFIVESLDLGPENASKR